MYVCVHMYIYIYIHIEREMYMCIHIYIYREREREFRTGERESSFETHLVAEMGSGPSWSSNPQA